MNKITDHTIEIENKRLLPEFHMPATLIIFPHIDDYFTIVGGQVGKGSMQVYVSKVEFLAMFTGNKDFIEGYKFRRINDTLMIRDDLMMKVNENKVIITVSFSECQEKLIECGLLRGDEVCTVS